ncbi:MAG: sulfotransferase domain-containing protein [Trichodesmium sp. St2_bin6]|nr:sulfotransferase domain-containing protein [Trichodesmium sp. MAG_R01]MDE5078340.1 sulfotransferase domain-containing protein [Trichodesmium sp. St2_bin6]
MLTAKIQKLVKSIIQEITYNFIIRERIKQIPIIQEMDRVRENDRYLKPKNLIPLLKKNIKTCLGQLAAFLELKVSEEVIDKVAIGSKLEEMKKNDKADCNWMIINQNEAPHLRKGIVGDWRNYFTSEQNQRFNDLYIKKMSGSKFKDYWDESILGITRED